MPRAKRVTKSKQPKSKPGRKADTLNPNQLAFVEHYLATRPRNATAAYMLAYDCKRTTAGVEGCRLLKTPKVVEEIERREAEIARKVGMSAGRIRREIAAVAFSDVSHYMIDDAGEIALRPGAPKSALRAVSKVKRKTRTLIRRDANGDAQPVTETEVEIHLWDKPSALRLAAQHKGMLVNRLAGPNGEPLPPGATIPTAIEVVFVNAENGKPRAG